METCLSNIQKVSQRMFQTNVEINSGRHDLDVDISLRGITDEFKNALEELITNV